MAVLCQREFSTNYRSLSISSPTLRFLCVLNLALVYFSLFLFLQSRVYITLFLRAGFRTRRKVKLRVKSFADMGCSIHQSDKRSQFKRSGINHRGWNYICTSYFTRLHGHRSLYIKWSQERFCFVSRETIANEYRNSVLFPDAITNTV